VAQGRPSPVEVVEAAYDLVPDEAWVRQMTGHLEALLKDGDQAHEARAHRSWRCVFAHVAAARRLRAAIGAGQPGRTLREALRSTVLEQERAWGGRRPGVPRAATDAWRGVVDGSWSLVDHYLEDGRRYLVARRNEVGVTDPRALSRRERAVVEQAALGKANKLIAHELRLAESTVATHLARAMRKLRIESRVELVNVVAGLGEPR
jgi:DNA-binding CsgD family transcriptional regulator